MNQNEHLGFLKVTHTHIQKEKRPLPNAEKVSFYFQNLVTSINELVAMAAPWSKVQIYPSDSFEAMSTKLNGINQKKNYSFIKVSCFLFGWLVGCLFCWCFLFCKLPITSFSAVHSHYAW